LKRAFWIGVMAALPLSCLPFLLGVTKPKKVQTAELAHWGSKRNWPAHHLGYLDSLAWYNTFYHLPRLPSVWVFNGQGLLMYRRSNNDCDKTFLHFLEVGDLTRRLPLDSIPWEERAFGWKLLNGKPLPLPKGKPRVVSLWTCYTPGLHRWVDSVENRLKSRKEEEWEHWIVSADWVGWKP